MPGIQSRPAERRSRPLRPARLPVVLLAPLVLLAAVLTLAACGGGQAGRSMSASSTARSVAGRSAMAGSSRGSSPGALAAGQPATVSAVLCTDLAAASRVLIARSPTLERSSPPRLVLSAQTAVTDAALVRALAQAVCSLPRMSTRIMCPMLVEGTYTLWFSAAGHRYPVVRVQESGCETVTGIGPVRTAATSSRFWQALARAARAGSTSSPRPVYIPQAAQPAGCTPVSRHPTGTMRRCPGPAQPGVNPGGPMQRP